MATTLSLVNTSCTSTKPISSAVNTIQTIQKVSNIAGTANEISGVLSSTLGMYNNQKTSLTGILTDYITGSNAISGLAKTNIKDYGAKLVGLNTGSLGKMKSIMTVAQYTKLLGLGKSKNSSNMLSNLTGGSSLSNDAKSVLGGLLF